MKFLLDMGISPEVGAFLRGLGFEATHLHDEGLDTLPDPSILLKAREQGYVLLTHDLDFPELVAASRAALPSVIVFRLNNMKPDKVIFHLQKVLDQTGSELEHGAIVSVTDGLMRVRTLPISSHRG
jgi:predicted nuclease of predicted toxin-antitoxin system